VDKTGTLTEGKPKLVTIEALGGLDESALLRLAAALERSSEHPLAPAILAAAKQRGIESDSAEAFESHPGRGVTGRLGGRAVAIGNRALLDQLGVSPEAGAAARSDALRRDGQTEAWMVLDGKLAALLGFEDPIKASARETIERLHAEGLRIVMVTGDSHATADVVAHRLGIDEVAAGVLPAQKVDVVQRLQAARHVVAMAGDGINDAPALAQANVGIAMGTGTDVAIESAEVTLVRGDLGGIVRARRLSRATMHNIRQNLFFAFVYNTIGVPIAAGVLYPFFGLLLSPILAAAAMSFSSVSVIANALRLRSTKL
jgi:Cu+-exporting ATPase